MKYHNVAVDVSSSNAVARKSASSPSSSYSNSTNSWTQPQEKESRKPPPAYLSALHSARKPPGKNVILKKPIAPMPPTPPKIYKVNPDDFRDVVQRLTGPVDQPKPTRLQEVAPPPLSLSPPHRQHSSVKITELLGKSSGDFADEAQGEIPRKSFDSSCGELSPLGFSLSPSSIAWWSSGNAFLFGAKCSSFDQSFPSFSDM